jgi:hypothetical protein
MSNTSPDRMTTLLASARTIIGFAALALVAAAILKMTGVTQIRYGTMELAVVAIACALVSR